MMTMMGLHASLFEVKISYLRECIVTTELEILSDI